MMTPLKPWQKFVAYAALAIVLLWTLFGLFAIWLLLTDPRG
jgi:hypothetical protein